MRSHTIRQRTIATAGVLVALLAGAATLRAAIGDPPPVVHAQLAASGSISLSNSSEDAAIFTLANLGPGDSGQGEVTIGNTGSAPGALRLSSLDLSDIPGRFGGALSGRLALHIVELGPGSEPEVFDGLLASMPELQLGVLEAGESRTYRFVVTMLDAGPPASPFVDDNLYQRASASLGYRWTLTEAEGGPEPKPSSPATPAPDPSPAQPPQPGGDQLGKRLVGTGGRDSLVGSQLRDVILGRGGADRIFGRRGRDRLIGGGGRDRIRGGPGRDRIFARDGEVDSVDCGKGRDTASVDERDLVRSCERIRP